jgi:5-formaminoimidazole-4-carboxamide-1-(beta)-D-ribofuranosyl 5'-monophosphate synthetase
MLSIDSVLKTYNPAQITIGVLGGHSALEVCEGAKKMGFQTLVVAQKGREKTYEKYYRTRDSKPILELGIHRQHRGCIDHLITLDKFADIVKPEVQEELRGLNTIFVHNRYFWVYCDFNAIENDFNVPIYGTRHMVRLEERDVENNQYFLLEKAGIRIPKIIRSGDSSVTGAALAQVLGEHFVINKGGPIIVKVNEATRSYERAFFVATSAADFEKKTKEMLEQGKITQTGLDKAVIEEFIIGAQVNLNFFYSPLTGELELMGTDMRRQTSLDGFLRLNADVQNELLTGGYQPSMVETGHVAVTMKESLLEKAFDIGEKFVKATKEHAAPGIMGPFALQGAVAAENGREEFVIFDVSMRIPGSPGTRFTPYTSYLWGQPMSFGERIALDIKEALESGRLGEIVT